MDPKLQKIFICPITLQIFKDPVTLSDGNTYEKQAVSKLIKTNQVSPLTRKPFTASDKKLQTNYTIQNMVEHYLKEGLISVDEIYTEYVVLTAKLVKKIADDTNKMKELIDKCAKTKQLEECIYRNYKLIHYVCKYSSFEVLKHLVDKGVNLEAETEDGIRPIHYVSRYAKFFKSVMYLIDRGVDINATTCRGWTALHFICTRYRMPFAIKYMIEKGAEVNKPAGRDFYPIHLACISGTCDGINALIKAGAKLDVKTLDGLYPIHYVSQYGDFSSINLIFENTKKIDKNDDRLNEIFKYRNFDYWEIAELYISKRMKKKNYKLKQIENATCKENWEYGNDITYDISSYQHFIDDDHCDQDEEDEDDDYYEDAEEEEEEEDAEEEEEDAGEEDEDAEEEDEDAGEEDEEAGEDQENRLNNSNDVCSCDDICGPNCNCGCHCNCDECNGEDDCQCICHDEN